MWTIFDQLNKPVLRFTGLWSSLVGKETSHGVWGTKAFAEFSLTRITVGGTITSLSLLDLRDLPLYFDSCVCLCMCASRVEDNLFTCTHTLIGFSNLKLRTAVLSILRLVPGSLVFLAPVCSSFSFMSSSQSKRFVFMPEGDENVWWVKAGNVMSCRVTLLCHLCMALGVVFIVEQPGSERFGMMPRWQNFSSQICYAPWLQDFFSFSLDEIPIYLPFRGTPQGINEYKSACVHTYFSDSVLTVYIIFAVCSAPHPISSGIKPWLRSLNKRYGWRNMVYHHGSQLRYGQTLPSFRRLIWALCQWKRGCNQSHWQPLI